jgi:hypothetical protein
MRLITPKCNSPGTNSVMIIKADGYIGPRKNPVKANASALRGREGSDQIDIWKKRVASELCGEFYGFGPS